MSMRLILWKAPVVQESEQAAALLRPWYDRRDDSGFEASDDLARFADELRRRFPDDASRKPPGEGAPRAEVTLDRSERVLSLRLRRGAGDPALNAVIDLAEEHRLVLYDPQGPGILVPFDDGLEIEWGPPQFADYVRLGLFGLGSAGLLVLGLLLPVPMFGPMSIAFGGFLTAVFLLVLVRILLARRGAR